MKKTELTPSELSTIRQFAFRESVSLFTTENTSTGGGGLAVIIRGESKPTIKGAIEGAESIAQYIITGKHPK
jgi:hypothetical protein